MSHRICWIIILILTTLLPRPASSQTYIVTGDFDYAPFSFIDKAGRPAGLEIEVLQAIAKLTGINISIQLSSWDNALSNMHAGKSDIIVGIIFSEERAEYFDFTIPIHTEYYSIFIRKNLPLDDLSLLYDYKLAVLDKDISIDKYLIPMGLYQNYILSSSLPEALSAIELGLADYVLAPNLLGLNEIRQNNYKNIEIKGPSIIPSIYTMAVAKGDIELLETLNRGIVELRRNGTLMDIQEKWKVYENEEATYQRLVRIIAIVFIVAVILLVLVVIWIWQLRKQIRRQTQHLNLKNIALQQSEEKFRVITDNSSDVIWHLNNKFEVTYISPADERIRGFKSDEIIGHSLFSILKPEGIQLLMEANKRRMDNLSKGIRSETAVYELEQRCKDGSWIWVEASAEAFYDKDGHISGYHGVSRDITKRKKAELLLIEREAQLRELNLTKDKLFSIIAHDLRSPFNAILGFSEILVDKSEPVEQKEADQYLSYIYSAARNTLILLDNLLIWARSQSGNMAFNPKKLIFQDVMNEILDVAVPMAVMKNISIRYVPTEEVEVYADANMLKTILRNLISNAVKYTHPNGFISISLVRNNGSIDITVADDGVGMTEDVLQKLFNVDKSVSTMGTANEKGSGLGLILCKDFVEKHQGTIWVESAPGKGSAFSFSLPMP